MTTFPCAVEMYETSDGKLHDRRSKAESHEKRIAAVAEANRLFVAGASLTGAMREAGLLPDGICLDLDEVFTTTELVIRHWQCRDNPGYRPCSILIDGGVYVHGHAGSWSGPYGSACTLQDLSRYWRDTKEWHAAESNRKGRCSP